MTVRVRGLSCYIDLDIDIVIDMRISRTRTAKLASADTENPERELAYRIAQDVYDLRTEQGLSQKELAEMSGTKQPRISTLESVTGAAPTLSLLLKVATALDAQLIVRIERNPQS